jgi:hypothetical protein
MKYPVLFHPSATAFANAQKPASHESIIADFGHPNHHRTEENGDWLRSETSVGRCAYGARIFV